MKKIALCFLIILFPIYLSYSQDTLKGASRPGKISIKGIIKIQPSDISCRAIFQESSGDNILSSGEEGQIVITVQNLNRKEHIKPEINISIIKNDSVEISAINKQLNQIRPNQTVTYITRLEADELREAGVYTFKVKAIDKITQIISDQVEVSYIAEKKLVEKRLALVIGNSKYKHAALLRNPVNDATDISEKLSELGFEVMRKIDCRRDEMRKSIDKFGVELQKYDVGLFYYAGHGGQANGANYLFPTDADPQFENQVEFHCVPVNRILSNMEGSGSKINIVILDACRDNPFERSWSRSARGRGLKVVNYQGILIAYSTAPGSTAMDGIGRNSPYTSALLHYVDTPNVTIESLFKRVRASVKKQTEDKQIPWESTMLTGEFYFIQD